MFKSSENWTVWRSKCQMGMSILKKKKIEMKKISQTWETEDVHCFWAWARGA